MIDRLAIDTRRRYGGDPSEVFEQLGVEIIEHPLAGRVMEIYFGDFVVIKSGIDVIRRNCYLAHALGHHLIHKRGNYLCGDSISHLCIQIKEGEAEDFAAHFLIPDESLFTYSLEYAGESIQNVAELLQVLPELLSRKLQFWTGGTASRNLPRFGDIQ